VIELRFLIPMPLKTEARGVMLRVHKTGDPVDEGISALAAWTQVASRLIIIELSAAAQATQNCLQISGQG
jgi:hypothetical protein